ncbi:hypothetical protein Tco_0759880 [Tanacetum coccineum]
MEDVRYQLNTSSLQERRTVEFRRISLTGFRSCTSRSHYRASQKADNYTLVRLPMDIRLKIDLENQSVC